MFLMERCLPDLLASFVALRDFSELWLGLCRVRHTGNHSSSTRQKRPPCIFSTSFSFISLKKLLCKSKLITTQSIYISALIRVECELLIIPTYHIYAEECSQKKWSGFLWIKLTWKTKAAPNVL